MLRHEAEEGGVVVRGRLELTVGRREGLTRTATRSSFGTISFRSERRLLRISGLMRATPVMFPPGRARFVTNPWTTGSPAGAMTIGTVAVDAFAAMAAWKPTATIRFTRACTRSLAILRSRSRLPSA